MTRACPHNSKKAYYRDLLVQESGLFRRDAQFPGRVQCIQVPPEHNGTACMVAQAALGFASHWYRAGHFFFL